jgi:DHA2 family multidrug resistance protein
MALAEMVFREARAIAYMNDFRLLALLALAAMPMTVLLRRPGPRRAVGAAG